MFIKNESKVAEKVYHQALNQIEEELIIEMSPAPMKSTTNYVVKSVTDSPTLSPLYLTALVRLAELISQEEDRYDDLEKIKQKMALFHSMMDQSFSMGEHIVPIVNIKSQQTMAESARKHSAPSCGRRCDDNIDHSIKQNYLYNVN